MHSYRSANTLEFVVSVDQNESDFIKIIKREFSIPFGAYSIQNKTTQQFTVVLPLYKHCSGWVLLNKDRIDRVICLIHVL